MNHHAVVGYHSFNDPIFKGLMVKYLKAYQVQDLIQAHTFHIITFEQPEYIIPEKERRRICEELNDIRIFWYPLKYHSGGSFLVLKKLWDLLLCIRSVMQIHKSFKLRSVIGFTSISGGISYIITRLIRVKVIALNIEPHSDFMTDFKIWSKSSFKYLLLKFLENQLILKGDHIAVPSRDGFSYWRSRKKRGNLYFVPTCIDFNDFKIPLDSKQKLRISAGLPLDRKIILYLGKFGGIYYEMNEAAQLFRKLLNVNRDLFFYIITTDNLEDLREKMNFNGLEGFYLLKDRIPYEQLTEHIFSADFGIVLIPPYANQRYRCPIKTANYLACGIPYIIENHIGDDSAMATRENIGIVIDDDHMVVDSLNQPTEFYRETAKKYRDITFVVDFLTVALSDTKLN